MANKQPYDELYLIDRIKEDLTGDVTNFTETWYSFSNAVVSVTGTVYEDYKEIRGDYWTPTDYKLISRVADFEEIVLSMDDEDARVLTLEEIYYIKKEVEKE